MSGATCVAEIQMPGIDQGLDDTSVKRSSFKQADAAFQALARLLSNYKVVAGDVIYLSHDRARVLVKMDGDLPIPDVVAEKISGELRALLDEVAFRYAQAYSTRQALERSARDMHALGFNRAVHAAEESGAEFRFFPSSPWAWKYQPVDPSTLAAPEPTDVKFEKIVGALVTGAGELGGVQGNLLSDEIDVFLNIANRIPVVRCRMTREEAQNAWHGVTRLTATLRMELGSLPQVEGKLKLIRE